MRALALTPPTRSPPAHSAFLYKWALGASQELHSKSIHRVLFAPLGFFLTVGTVQGWAAAQGRPELCMRVPRPRRHPCAPCCALAPAPLTPAAWPASPWPSPADPRG